MMAQKRAFFNTFFDPRRPGSFQGRPFTISYTVQPIKEGEMSEQNVNYEPQYREEEAPLLRKVIAKRMIESKTTNPHFYLTVDVDVRKLIAMRNGLNEGREKKISFNDIIMKAVALNMVKHPECNVSYVDDKIRYYGDVNICLAVAIEGGLLTPAVRNCEKKTIEEISAEADALVEKARSRRLRPRESMGGTFTLSNLGMFGIEEFAAIVNPPQALILAVGAIREVPVVNQGNIEVGKRMKMTLSCDHKAVDGATGAVFLQDLKAALEDPAQLGA
jgi:pyruvate dehydrogenase E2 component (dihydrolipoamide acetyltransferase)